MQKSEQDRVIIEASDSESSSKKSAIRVLHVDDDQCILEISKQILMDIGNFEIDFAFCVDEAFKKLSTEHYDIVISDFEMPQKNGLDFLKELRDQNNQIPFILFTGKGKEDIAIKALNLGADRYINKQGNPETVYGELSNALIKTIEHKQSKKMLVESESKYRKLVENSLQGIAIIQGPPPQFVFANLAMKELFGYTPEELVALTPEQIVRSVHPDDREDFFDRFKKRIEGKPAKSTYVFRGFRKDGTLRWVEVCANLIEFNGKPAVQGVFLDITENKKAEESLRESEQRYRELANCLPDIVFETDLNGQLEFANERAAQISGYDIKEIEKGLNILQFIVPEDRERAAKKIRRLLSGSSYTPAEYKFLRKDGTTFPALVTATPRICKNKITGLRGIALDISERKKIENAQLESEEKFRKAFLTSPDAVYLGTLVEGKILEVNEHFEEVFGYTRQEVIDKTSLELGLWTNPLDRKEIVSRLRSDGKVKNLEVFGTRKNGQIFPVQISISVIETNCQQLILGIIRDISTIKKNEAELARSQLSMQSIVESTSDMIWSVSCDDFALLTFNQSLKDYFLKNCGIIIKAGMHQEDLFSNKELVKKWRSYYQRVLKEGPFTTEYKATAGALILQVSFNVIKRGKKLFEISAFGKDITERKKAEEAIEHSEIRFRSLYENSFDAILLTKPDGSILSANPAASLMFGMSEEEIKAAGRAGLVVMDERARLALRAREQSGKAKSELTFRRKNGSTFEGESTSSIFMDADGVAKTSMIIRDITERKKAEEDLRASSLYTRSLLEASLDPLVTISKEGKITDVNEATELVTGCSREELIGSDFSEYFTNSEQARTGYRKVFTEGLVKDYPLCIKHKSGKLTDVLYNATIYRNPRGEIQGVFAAARDTTERKKIERSLIESEKKFRTLAEESPNMIFINNKGRVVYANKKCEEITGYSREEFYSPKFNFLSLNPPEYHETVKSAYSKHTKNETVSPYEYVLITKDGERINAIINTTLVEYDGDKAILGIITDITERKKTEGVLRQERDMLESVAKASGAGLVIVSKDYHVLWANDFIKRYKGDTIGKLCYATLNNLNAPCADCGVTKIFAGKTTLDSHEYCSTTIDGNQYWVQIVATPLKDERGNVASAMEICVDITERKKNEFALTESETRSRAIVANSPIGIATSDANKRFLSANEAFCKILGYKENELRKLTFVDITYSADLKASIAKMDELENGNVPCFSLEKRYIKKDGTIIDGKIMVSVVRNTKGEPSLYVAELEDITERKKAEEHRKVLERKLNEYSKHLKWMVDLRTAQLKDANERVVKSERLAAIGELAGMVGHDLRNPLTGIKNAAYFLKKKGTAISETQAKEMLEIIDKSIDHSNKIINDLLDYSREMNLELTKYEARTLLNETLRMIQVPDRIQILNHIQKETWIWVNSDKMMRVFLNLIRNAIDAIPDKGFLEIRSHQTRDSVEISFADTGSGIPEETMRKLFTPLFTTKAQGMGFGLAICKRIVEAHGGTITVKTAVNKGTTFTISLPIKAKVPLSDNQSVLENQNAN